MNWLKNALNLTVSGKSKSAYDMLAPEVASHSEHIHYIENFSYMDVLPSQAASGKRTRFAIGDQMFLLQVFDENGRLEQSQNIASQQELDAVKSSLQSLIRQQYALATRLNIDETEFLTTYTKLETENKQKTDALAKAFRANTALKNSFSYKIGRMITWLPRKIRDGLQSLLRKRRS